ncbi:DUF1330 domain-containing protein [Variovorax boronicumulans]|uniref:DUF1330 domain-containing protein n=1 Tax=Variovorax boronicumulans TaxID=436515 RepID=UPI0015572C56
MRREINALEGEAGKRIVMIAFLSPKQARAWYESTAYRADSADSFQLREVSRVHRRKRPSTGADSLVAR